MRLIDAQGAIMDPRIVNAISPTLEDGSIASVQAIVVHQTGGPTAQFALDGYKRSGANGTHFMFDKVAMRLCLLLWLGLAASACLGKDGCTEPTEYQPALCPVKLPRIASVRIEENGATSPASDDQAAECSRFRLTPKSVRRYFAAAWETNESDAHHTLDWSPCYASGTLTFADGKSAHWSISQAGTGSLAPDEGARLFLYCPTCKRKPFKQ